MRSMQCVDGDVVPHVLLLERQRQSDSTIGCCWVSKLTVDGLLALEPLHEDEVLIYKALSQEFSIRPGSATSASSGESEGSRIYGWKRTTGTSFVRKDELVVVEGVEPVQRFGGLPDDEAHLGMTAQSRRSNEKLPTPSLWN